MIIQRDTFVKSKERYFLWNGIFQLWQFDVIEGDTSCFCTGVLIAFVPQIKTKLKKKQSCKYRIIDKYVTFIITHNCTKFRTDHIRKLK